MRRLGYVVVEWNQASRMPEVWGGRDVDTNLKEAQDDARHARRDAVARGRDERYTVAELVEVEDGA